MARIKVRKVDKRRFASEAAIILGILNDAWSDNWGFVPFTDAELVVDEVLRIVELARAGGGG